MAHYYACKFGLNRLRIDGDIRSGGGTGGSGGTIAPGRQRRGGTAPGDGANFCGDFVAMSYLENVQWIIIPLQIGDPTR